MRPNLHNIKSRRQRLLCFRDLETRAGWELNLQDYLYVKDDATLAQLVEQYREAKLLVLDTEFVRTRTYYACLGSFRPMTARPWL